MYRGVGNNVFFKEFFPGVGFYMVFISIKSSVDVDGGIHLDAKVIEHDENRTAEFDRLCNTVIRFTNEQIFDQIEHVLQKIIKFAQTLSQNFSPSPQGEAAGG